MKIKLLKYQKLYLGGWAFYFLDVELLTWGFNVCLCYDLLPPSKIILVFSKFEIGHYFDYGFPPTRHSMRFKYVIKQLSITIKK